MVDEEYLGRQRWSRNKQAVFIVAWISFLVAAIGTMVFFAFFDPVDLVGTIDDGLDIGRDTGYAAGFFFFWALCALCSGVTAYLLRTAPKGNAGPRQQ
jgi:polyferredoxin